MFEAIEAEVRERFVECQRTLIYIQTLPNADQHPAPTEISSLRGLWLVNLYGAMEKSINLIASEVIDAILADAVVSSTLKPSLHGVFHFSRIQALKDCGSTLVIEKSIDLMRASHSTERIDLIHSPLPDKLQNVDADTILLLCNLLSMDDYEINMGRRGRINHLKDRRNAISHGRETAQSIGARINFVGLQDLFNLTQEEVVRFMDSCKNYCTLKSYLN